MGLGREADNGHSLARLEPMNQVGGKADTCGGLFAVGTLQPSSGIKIGQMDERFSAKWGN